MMKTPSTAESLAFSGTLSYRAGHVNSSHSPSTNLLPPETGKAIALPYLGGLHHEYVRLAA